MAHHPVDDCNDAPNEHFQDVLAQARLNRRDIIRGGFGLAALSTVPMLAACGGTPEADLPSLGFDPVAKSLADAIQLPPGYTYTVVHATGDRLSTDVTPYSNQGLEADDWSLRVGDHHDGMEIFFIGRNGRYTEKSTDRAVLAINHESSADAHFFHPRGQTTNGVNGKKFSQFGGWDQGKREMLEVLKEINHHGVSVAEIERGKDGRWTYKVGSEFNRRVNGQTRMRISGPAAHLRDIQQFMVTKYAPDGKHSRGTLNNCGSGKTPWGTYLACEENWAAYWYMPPGSADVDERTKASRQRYGVINAPVSSPTALVGSQGWSSVSSSDDRFARFNVSAPGATPADDFRNEPNTFGFNVEIDPLDRKAMPAKRVAMGRFAHEAAVCGLPEKGQPLAFYMGCDSNNEYIYKFVSTARWDPRDVGGGMAAGDKYLGEGKLYAAKFNADGSGQWLELDIAQLPPSFVVGGRTYTFANQADVLVNTRIAASAAGATRMDRPEWGAVNPRNGEVYFTLTNNSSRNAAGTDAANPRAYADNDGRGRSGNPNGHIIRFREAAGASTATEFTWDIFLFGAEEDASQSTINLSKLTAVNDFSSPDGLWFSPSTGICWIQTDDGAYTDQTNCMLLAAIPGEVGDGGEVSIANAGATVPQKTFLGATLGEARLRRFLVGPKGCEITGLTEADDGRTIFVNIQHPGEDTPAIGAAAEFSFQSNWPANAGYGPGQRPRSATIAIRRQDGKPIGL
jgi:uncharacterized protein